MNLPLLLLSSIALGLIAATLARRNGRNAYFWFGIGFVFGLLGVLALFLIPPSRKKIVPTPLPKPVPQPFIDGPLDRFWYYLNEKREQQGPMSHNALTQAWQSGSIRSDTFVWHEDLPNWKPLQELIKFKNLS